MLIVFVWLLALTPLAACNTAGKDNATADSVQPATAAVPAQTSQSDTMKDPAGAYQSVAGSILALDSGEEVPVLSVGDFDQRLNKLDGLVAIEGRVKESYPERGALVLVDFANMAGCSDGCCPQAEVPVRLALEEYSGSLPEPDREIVVIGDISVSETGYDLAVREIRQDEEILLRLKT